MWEKMVCQKRLGFLLLKSMMSLALESGLLPIKPMLSLEGTSPKAGSERTGLSVYGSPQFFCSIARIWLEHFGDTSKNVNK